MLFDDESIWDKGTTELEKVELTKIKNHKLLEYIKNRAGIDDRYFATKYGDKWVCVCGRVNYDDLPSCKRCIRRKDDVLAAYSDEEKIWNDVKADEELEAERQRKLEEDRQRQLEINKLKVKKVTQYSSIAVIVTLIIGVTVFGFMTNFTFSMANDEQLKNPDTPVAEMKEDLSLEIGAGEDIENLEDVRHLENQQDQQDQQDQAWQQDHQGLQNTSEKKPLEMNAIIDTSFVWGGSNGRGDFIIKYRKDGSVKML